MIKHSLIKKWKANAYYHGKEFLQKLLLILFFSNKFKISIDIKKMETLKIKKFQDSVMMENTF